MSLQNKIPLLAQAANVLAASFSNRQSRAMIVSTAILLATGFAGLAAAQTPDITQNATGVYPYTVNAGSVDAATKSQWCQAQTNSCGEICLGRAFPNSCDPVSPCHENPYVMQVIKLF